MVGVREWSTDLSSGPRDVSGHHGPRGPSGRVPTKVAHTKTSHKTRYFAAPVTPVTLPARGLTWADTTRSSGRRAFAAPVSPVGTPAGGGRSTYLTTARFTDRANLRKGVYSVSFPKWRLTHYDTATSILYMSFWELVCPVDIVKKTGPRGDRGPRETLRSRWS